MPISFLFFLKKKKEVGERKKKKQVRTYREKRSHNAARVFEGVEYCLCDHFNKNARKTLAFSGYLV